MPISSVIKGKKKNLSDLDGGVHRDKYYITMKNGGKYDTFVYDTINKMWHKEDHDAVVKYYEHNEETIVILQDGFSYLISDTSTTPEEGPVHWMAETGEIGLDLSDLKYISKCVIRMKMVPGASVSVFIQYDSTGDWEHVSTFNSKRYYSYDIPLRTRICDHFKLRITGVGESVIYSITNTIDGGYEP